MATSKKFSELPAASAVGNGDLFAIAHEDALAETGYVSQKLTAAQAGQKVNGDTEYPTSLPSFPENGQNPFAALEKLNADIDALYPVNTASGSIANFTTSLVKPLTELTSTIVAQQASGTPTPSSPLPISGFSLVKFGQVSDYGEYFNGLFLGTYDFIDLGSLTWTAFTGGASNTFTVQIPKQNGLSNFICADYARFEGNIADMPNMTSRGQASSSNIYIRNTSCSTKEEIKTALNGVYLIYKLATPTTPTITAEQFATLCTAFGITGNTFTINLGQTIYAGSVDCISGRVMNSGVKLTLNGDIATSDLRLTAQTGFTQIEWYPYRAIGKGTEVFKCDKFEFNIEKGLYRVSNNNLTTAPRMFFGLPDTVTTREEAVAWFASNPTEIVYELATPTEITGLTPANFTTINGENNIFSDCGEVSASFKQTVQEYIDAKIAETQALVLNS